MFQLYFITEIIFTLEKCIHWHWDFILSLLQCRSQREAMSQRKVVISPRKENLVPAAVGEREQLTILPPPRRLNYPSKYLATAIQPCTPCHSRGLWAFAFRFLISHLPYFSIKYLSVMSFCFFIFLSLSHRPSTTSRYEYNMKHHKKSIIYTSYVERKENLHCHILGIYFFLFLTANFKCSCNLTKWSNL